MELGDIVKDMKIADCEQQLYQRVALHEMALNAQAGAEVQAAVGRHEMWLNEKAEAEVRRARMEVHQSLYAHEARQHQLAQISRNMVVQGEAQFMENAESEMKQFGQYVVSHSKSEHREKLEESTQVVRRFFERQYEVHAHGLNEEYQRALKERSAQLREECHSELLSLIHI